MSADDTFSIGIMQMRCVKDSAVNRQRAERQIREAARRGGEGYLYAGTFYFRVFLSDGIP